MRPINALKPGEERAAYEIADELLALLATPEREAVERGPYPYLDALRERLRGMDLCGELLHVGQAHEAICIIPNPCPKHSADAILASKEADDAE